MVGSARGTCQPAAAARRSHLLGGGTTDPFPVGLVKTGIATGTEVLKFACYMWEGYTTAHRTRVRHRRHARLEASYTWDGYITANETRVETGEWCAGRLSRLGRAHGASKQASHVTSELFTYLGDERP